jgi:hypothetical protein
MVRRTMMFYRNSIAAATLAAALLTTMAGARAFDDSLYPNFKGQWLRTDSGDPVRYDGSKPALQQQPPLNAEYQAIYEANTRDQNEGGQGVDPTYTCLARGMPRVMNVYSNMEFVILPETTYILQQLLNDDRRIFTDGRDWPNEIEPTYAGYSLGKWLDTDGDGVYDTLEVETRGPFKGPRAYDATGLPLHFDNESTFKERIWRDKADPKILHDEITVFDHALTRPWTVDKKYVHEPTPNHTWAEFYCTENPSMIAIGKESYFLSTEGLLMPVRKDQPPPDLRYFKQR